MVTDQIHVDHLPSLSCDGVVNDRAYHTHSQPLFPKVTTDIPHVPPFNTLPLSHTLTSTYSSHTPSHPPTPPTHPHTHLLLPHTLTPTYSSHIPSHPPTPPTHPHQYLIQGTPAVCTQLWHHYYPIHYHTLSPTLH